MKLYKKQFLDLEKEFTTFDNAKVAVLPCPYEGGISYGAGATKAPDAIFEASRYLELYDEILDAEPYRAGITTIEPPSISRTPESMLHLVNSTTLNLIKQNKFVVLVGGDHSITTGYARTLDQLYNQFSVIQIDAHADLRDVYEGSQYSHACVMSRIREFTSHTLQIGIRSCSKQEADKIKVEGINVCTMHMFRTKMFNLDDALEKLPNPVFITLDVDALDWSIIASTGTPEPGGFLWDEITLLLHIIFSNKNVIGFDVVELAANEYDRNSPFAVAKLIYKMIGFKFYDKL
jgi:agmatinase